MNFDEYIAHWDAAFLRQKKLALRFIEAYNESLPTESCPVCQCSGHVPGLPCPECSHVHPVSWVILRDNEFGYEAVALGTREIVASFSVEDCVD